MPITPLANHHLGDQLDHFAKIKNAYTGAYCMYLINRSIYRIYAHWEVLPPVFAGKLG